MAFKRRPCCSRESSDEDEEADGDDEEGTANLARHRQGISRNFFSAFRHDLIPLA